MNSSLRSEGTLSRRDGGFKIKKPGQAQVDMGMCKCSSMAVLPCMSCMYVLYVYALYVHKGGVEGMCMGWTEREGLELMVNPDWVSIRDPMWARRRDLLTAPEVERGKTTGSKPHWAGLGETFLRQKSQNSTTVHTVLSITSGIF